MGEVWTGWVSEVRPHAVSGASRGPPPVRRPARSREVPWATAAQVEAAVASGRAPRAPRSAAVPAHVRAEALDARLARGSPSAPTRSRALITAENGKPLKWARAEVARAVSTFRWAAEEARRWSGELQRLDTDAGGDGTAGARPPLPARPGPRHLAVQLPAQPGRAQGRARRRRRRPDRAEAGAQDAAVRPAARRAVRRDRPAGRRRARSSSCPTSRAPALVADPRLPVVSFTGSGPGRARDPRGRAAQARHARARRQRGGGGLRRLVLASRPRLGGVAHRDVRQLPGRAVVHLGAARARRRRRCTTTSWRAWSPRSRRSGSATRRRRRPPTSAR